MRDDKKLNKVNMFTGLIGQIILLLMGLASLVVLVMGILNQYGVIQAPFTIANFNVVGIILGFIMAFCFIFFPIRNIVRYVKHIKGKKYVQPNVVTISSQTQPTVLTDAEVKHNKEIKQFGKSKQNNSKAELVQIIFVSIMIAIFLACGIALLCQGERWGFVFILILIPFIYIDISNIVFYIAKKKNKPITSKGISPHFLGLCVVTALLVAPFIIIDDPAKFLEPLGIFYMAIGSFIFILLLGDFIYTCIHSVKYSRLAKGKVKGEKIKATYEGCKYKSSSTQTINGVPTKANVLYQVRYSYINANGQTKYKTSVQTFTFEEIAYLKYKQTFDILVHKNDSYIIEDLTNTDIPEDAKLQEDKPRLATTKEKLESSKFMPSFAKKNRWTLTLVGGIIMTAILEVAGIGMLLSNVTPDYTCYILIGLGALLLGYSIYTSVPNILCERKGQQATAKLLRLEVDHRRNSDHDSNRRYAVVEYNDEIKNVYLLYVEWYSILAEYIGKEIPVKVYKKTIAIDFQKMYSDLI